MAAPPEEPASTVPEDGSTVPFDAGLAPTKHESTLADGAATAERDDATTTDVGTVSNLHNATTVSRDGAAAGRAADVDGRPGVPREGGVPSIRVEGFEVRRKIGRGGQGDVYEAWCLKLERPVALKVLRNVLAADRRHVRRFQKEGRHAAKVADAGVVRIYDVCEDSHGAPVIVMEYVDGPDLDKLLRERTAVKNGSTATPGHRLSTLGEPAYREEVLKLLDQVIDAVAATHEVGVIHRDIKPSNILVDRRGRVRLSDFGLSRWVEDARGTDSDQPMGTRGYMPSEQWDASPDVDERSDVFALGATIYRALTLELPYGQARPDVEARCPAASVSRDFDAVVRKALEPDRAHRYESAVALREDWRRVRNGEPPLFRPVGRLERLRRKARRHLAVTSSLLVVVLLLIALLFGAWNYAQVRGLLAQALARDPQRPRAVRFPTEPPGARIAVAPLDPVTGDPRLDRPVFAESRADTGLFHLPPGDYLVEALWDNGHFAHVYRHVPGTNESVPGSYRHLYWKNNGGVLEYRPVRDREGAGEPVHDGMTRFEGSDAFVAPGDPAIRGASLPRRVAPFDLDRTEVTMGEFYRPWSGLEGPPMPLPAEGRKLAGNPREAVRYLNFHAAIHYAELRGKRLPLEAELRFAATNGGHTRYPWGNEPLPAPVVGPTVGPVGLDPRDRLLSHPEVVGLGSNVAEWTMTRATPVPTPPALLPNGSPSGIRASDSGFPQSRVLGSRPSVATGLRLPETVDQPDEAVIVPAYLEHEGIGLRLARSAAPYFFKTGAKAPPR